MDMLQQRIPLRINYALEGYDFEIFPKHLV
jgi:hypothetical protein